MRTSSTIVSAEGYLELSHKIHAAEARSLLTAGRIDEALVEIARSQAALPGETSLAAELVPRLQKADRAKEADALFAEIFAVNRRVCEDFPRAADYHHELARLAIQCGRRLDEALPHAEQAVNLLPHNATYADTLATLRERL